MSDQKNEDTGQPMVLVLAAIADGGRAGALKASLSGLIEQHAISLIKRPEAFDKAARKNPQAKLVAVFVRPDIELGLALETGAEAEKAMHDWSLRIEALLAVLRRNRRRTTVIDDATLLGDPSWAHQLLGGHIMAPQTPLRQPSALLRLVGQALLTQDTAAAALREELLASSQGAPADEISTVEAQQELAALHAVYAREESLARELTQLKTATKHRDEEHGSVLAKLLSLQDLYQSSQQDLERKTAQITQLRQGLESNEALANELRAELEALRKRHTDEAAVLEESLSTLNERSLALEALEGEAQSLRRKVQDKSAEVELLTQRLAQTEGSLRARDAEIAAFFNSKSYRMTAPLRWLRAVLSRRRA